MIFFPFFFVRPPFFFWVEKEKKRALAGIGQRFAARTQSETGNM